jgi:hypothetical protein
MVLVMFDKTKKEWLTLTEEEADQLPPEVREKDVFYLDGLLKEKLDFGKKQQRNNNDVVGTISGDEGSGKSSLGANIMRYMSDDEFDPRKDMVGADFEDAVNKLTNIKKGGCLMFDEGNTLFLSTEMMKKEQRELHKVFSIFRQKNLFVLIVLPSFFRLSSYFALDRSRFLIRTYLVEGKRSFFAYYGNKTKAKLYREGKKFHNYESVGPTFRGRFSSCYKLETDEYRQFKLKTLRDALAPKSKKQRTEYQIEKDFQTKIIMQNSDKTDVEIASVLGISSARVGQIKKRMKTLIEQDQNSDNRGDVGD